MKTRLIAINLLLFVVLNSCCFRAKEKHLGNNIYLSEYDKVDRRILYQTERCATSGVEIVPMTVLEMSYNADWIIVKSGNERKKIDFKYWVIKNTFDRLPNSETVLKNTTEFTDYNLFTSFLIANNINLQLKKI